MVVTGTTGSCWHLLNRSLNRAEFTVLFYDVAVWERFLCNLAGVFFWNDESATFVWRNNNDEH
jgi:hypothetical protein